MEVADQHGVPDCPKHPNQDFLRALDRTEPTLALVLLVVLAVATGAAIVVGGWMLWQMDADLRSQGGGFYIGRGLLALVLLTAIAGISIAIWMTLKRHRSPETSAPEGLVPKAQPRTLKPPRLSRTATKASCGHSTRLNIPWYGCSRFYWV